VNRIAAAYASVILPVFNRHATLPYALASVQAQSRRDIEILVVLDGATEACRSIAMAAAADDSRIRVLDLPKGAGSGEVNRDLAVSRAAAERIFYIDDDDLFLPWHVETLGPLLDSADIADSRLCSADRNGSLHMGVARGGSEPIRQMLGSFRLKMLYDTHIAHRKDAHGKFSTWLPKADLGRDTVGEFFSGFANDPACRWASCDEVTAISLHGAARRNMGPESRAAEIARLSACVSSPATLQRVLSSANSIFNLFRLLEADRPGPEQLEQYLAARGGYPDVGSHPLEHVLFSLFRGVRPRDDEAIALAVQLSNLVESGYIFESVAAIFVETYGAVEAARLLQSMSQQDGDNQASRLATFAAALGYSDAASALKIADRACAIGPDPVGSLASWRVRLAELVGRLAIS